MSFIFAHFFASGMGLVSIFSKILASSLFKLFDDASGNQMPTIIDLSWLITPANYIFDESGNQMVSATTGSGGLIGFWRRGDIWPNKEINSKMVSKFILFLVFGFQVPLVLPFLALYQTD